VASGEIKKVISEQVISNQKREKENDQLALRSSESEVG
jgi:hypothetical protein